MSDYHRPAEDVFPLWNQPAPAQQHSATSRAAAEALGMGALNALQRVVFLWIAEHGPATDEEIAAGLGMNPSTARPRRIELVRRGFVVPAGTRRAASGRMATVWMVP